VARIPSSGHMALQISSISIEIAVISDSYEWHSFCSNCAKSMKVLIINTNRNTLPMPVLPIGACMVAEATEQAGHTVKVLDFMFEKNILQKLKKELSVSRPDIIGLSIRNIDNNDYEKPVFFLEEIRPIIDSIRTLTEATIVIGGAAVSVMPEEILRYTGASYAVTGDGEFTFPALAEKLSRGQLPVDVPGVAWLENGRFMNNPVSATNTHGCRTPDFSRWVNLGAYLSVLSTVPVQTKLGCRFQCIYCTYRKIEGDAYRLSSPECVVDTVKQLMRRGLRDIEFVDNVFNYPQKHAIEICEGISQACPGVRLQSLELNPLFIDDDLITAMERAGFTGMGITAESASDSVLKGLRKGFTVEDVHNAARIIQRHSLSCVWIFMFGGPGETESTVKDTLRFAETFVRPGDIAFFSSGIRIYPGTELESLARREGSLSLPPGEMLPPVFYSAPTIDYRWINKQIQNAMNTHMNFLNSVSIGLPFLPSIHRMGYKFGLRPPMWRYTRPIRRGLRFLGMDV
jgi:radical SAM superfamily enzyme YgiQ (UPF0313 family)